MTTSTLHGTLQRSRFAHLALSALIDLIPGGRRQAPASALARSEQASLEASKVRELAYSYSKTDPGFASDLYAAAARHEGLHVE